MCGIAGFTGCGESGSLEELVRAMGASLAHRGPDDAGCCVLPGCALAHRRLSIIDLVGGRQPMTTSDARWTLVFNGEIYNYRELREELVGRGVAFLTSSDTEVLLHLLSIDGPAALHRLNGMFALALWDAERQELMLARDRMGQKPLYYASVQGALVFASEMRAMRLHPSVRNDVDPLSVSKYLAYGYVPTPHTIYRDIFRLEPGSYLRFREGTIVEQAAYWQLPLLDRPPAGRRMEEAAEELVVLLRGSVRRRLHADVPVGIFLSGGIDSSAVTALAVEEAGGPVHTFSIGFEESSYDESHHARKVAEYCGTIHHHQTLSSREAVDLVPAVLAHLDEPLADASLVPTWMLSRFTRDHVTVALGGDGGDELFAGYPSFQAHRVVEALSFLPMDWRAALTGPVRRLPVSNRYASAGFLLQQFLKGAGISPEVRFMLWMGVCGNEQRRSLLNPSLCEELAGRDVYDDVGRLVRESGLHNAFPRLLMLCSRLYLQDQILVKVDRASMAHGLEVRAPFLDPHLVEFACGLPVAAKLHGLTTKAILKRAMVGHLPRRILHRRKAGFMMPLAGWLRGELRPMLEDLCEESLVRRQGLFHPETVQRLIREHVQGVRDHRKVLWSLLAFQSWQQHRTSYT